MTTEWLFFCRYPIDDAPTSVSNEAKIMHRNKATLSKHSKSVKKYFKD
jgi:hypothetical protein